MTADDEESGGQIAMGERNSCADGCGDRAAHARNNLVGDSGALERLSLFAPASEDKRVSALQTHDATPALCLRDQHRLDFVLTQGVTAGALPDEESLCA